MKRADIGVKMLVGLLGFIAGCPAGTGTGGGNQNDNSSDEQEGFCHDGSLSVIAMLSGEGAEVGTMEYREVNGCKEFIARVENFVTGTYDVRVSETLVGQLAVGEDGTGELIYDTEAGTFPPGFPTPMAGDSGDVGTIVSGTFAGDCPAVPKVCPGPHDDDGDDGNGDDLDDTDRVTLTVTLRSRTAGAVNMDAFVCIDEVFYTRATAPYNVAAICSRLTQSDAETVRDYVASRGQMATVIAVEDATPNTGGGGTGADPASLKSPSALYFAEWQGDTGNHPEEGVLNIAMTQDRSVIALFDIMPLITWGKINENHPEFGGGCFDYDYQAAPWLRFPGVEDVSQTASCISAGVNGDIILYGQLKPGAVITITAQEFPGANLQWIEWRGGPCGAARACRIEVEAGKDVSTIAVWRTPE